jgi:hypothetical protein
MCTGDFTWSYTLSSAGTGTGDMGPLNHADSYNFPESNNQCIYRDSALGIRPGTWKISALNLSCTVTLPATLGNSVLNMNNCQVLK